jgi:hypothetical protein
MIKLVLFSGLPFRAPWRGTMARLNRPDQVTVQGIRIEPSKGLEELWAAAAIKTGKKR